MFSGLDDTNKLIFIEILNVIIVYLIVLCPYSNRSILRGATKSRSLPTIRRKKRHFSPPIRNAAPRPTLNGQFKRDARASGCAGTIRSLLWVSGVGWFGWVNLAEFEKSDHIGMKFFIQFCLRQKINMRDQLGLVRGRRLQKNSSNGDLLRALWSTWSTWSTWSILVTRRRLLKKKNAHTHTVRTKK